MQAWATFQRHLLKAICSTSHPSIRKDRVEGQWEESQLMTSMGSNIEVETRSQSCSTLWLGIFQDDSVCSHCLRGILSAGSSCSFLYTSKRVRSPWLFQEIESSDIKSELFLGRTVLFTTEKTGKTSLKPELFWGFSKILRVIAVCVIWKTWNAIFFLSQRERMHHIHWAPALNKGTWKQELERQ